MTIYQFLTHITRVCTKTKQKKWELYKGIIVFGLEPNQKKLIKRWCTFIRQHWSFFNIPLHSLTSVGCSGLFLNSIIDGETCTVIWVLFHLFCDIYWYPCVKRRLEPVYRILSKCSGIKQPSPINGHHQGHGKIWKLCSDKKITVNTLINSNNTPSTTINHLTPENEKMLTKLYNVACRNGGIKQNSSTNTNP